MDREFISKAMKRHRHALRYAVPELKADREIVFAAVKKNGDGKSLELGHQSSRRAVGSCSQP